MKAKEIKLKLYSEGVNLDGKNHVLFSNRPIAYAKDNKYKQALAKPEDNLPR